ncbi:MAG: hypothetical protein Q8Q14_04620 [Gemmatimonadales bacterium]|nr:hypothetical protein [Gemmatimonadales bacterium]
MPKSKVTPRDAKSIRDRLKTFAARYGSWAEFLRRVNVPRTTGIAWSRLDKPGVPEVPFLLRLSRDANVNLNWLLLGEGPMLRERQTDDPAERVKAALEAELRQSEDASPEEFRAAWDRMMLRGDWSKVEDVVLQLAVDGVRPRFQENLRLVRHYAGLAHVYNGLREVLKAYNAKDPKRATPLIRQVERLLSEPLVGMGLPATDEAPGEK